LTTKYPLPGWRLYRSLAHQVCYLVLICASRCINMVGTIGSIKQVNMGIDEAGQKGPPTQIYKLSIPVTGASHLVIVTHGYNTSACAVDSHGLGMWLCGIHGVDVSIQIENDAHVLTFLTWPIVGTINRS
jgi:hypothetical protein